MRERAPACFCLCVTFLFLSRSLPLSGQSAPAAASHAIERLMRQPHERGQFNGAVLVAERGRVAVRVFLLNSTEHESSSNAFDSLAEADEVIGHRAAARANYAIAVEKDPTNTHLRTMLGRLK